MGRRIAFTDIHGCYYSMKKLLEEKVKIKREDTLFFLGDAINKGPFSREVLDYLMDIQEKNFNAHYLRGNHEEELLKVLSGNSGLDVFIEKGGNTFLKNLGVHHPEEIPEKYILFIRGFKYFYELPDFLLVHAGFNFQKSNPFVDSEEMLNIRDYKVDLEKTQNRRVIHGHSPTNLDQLVKSLEEKEDLHFSLDAGCVYHHDPQQAHLVALDLDSWELHIQPNIDESLNYDD